MSILVMTVMLSGCNEVRIEDGEEKFTTGAVKSASFVPAHSEVTIKYDGGLGTKFVGDEYKVVIDWGYGPSVFHDSESYSRFKDYVGYPINIKYCEQYQAEYNDDLVLLSRNVCAYKIIDMQISK